MSSTTFTACIFAIICAAFTLSGCGGKTTTTLRPNPMSVFGNVRSFVNKSSDISSSFLVDIPVPDKGKNISAIEITVGSGAKVAYSVTAVSNNTFNVTDSKPASIVEALNKLCKVTKPNLSFVFDTQNFTWYFSKECHINGKATLPKSATAYSVASTKVESVETKLELTAVSVAKGEYNFNVFVNGSKNVNTTSPCDVKHAANTTLLEFTGNKTLTFNNAVAKAFGCSPIKSAADVQNVTLVFKPPSYTWTIGSDCVLVSASKSA